MHCVASNSIHAETHTAKEKEKQRPTHNTYDSFVNISIDINVNKIRANS